MESVTGLAGWLRYFSIVFAILPLFCTNRYLDMNGNALNLPCGIPYISYYQKLPSCCTSTCTMLLSRLQTRCKHLIWSRLNVQVQLSFCTYFLLYPLVTTLQDWSVNYVRKLKCQPCTEAAHLANGYPVYYTIDLIEIIPPNINFL